MNGLGRRDGIEAERPDEISRRGALSHLRQEAASGTRRRVSVGRLAVAETDEGEEALVVQEARGARGMRKREHRRGDGERGHKARRKWSA